MEKSETMRILRENLENALKYMFNGYYQEAIPLVNNAILQCKKIEKEQQEVMKSGMHKY